MLDGESKIIQSAIGGEAPAFGLLYDHYQPKIYRFVAIKVGRREEAEDLTHQVFLNAWQNIASYRDLGFPFGSWLYHIARNLIVDHYRTAGRSVALSETDSDRLSSEEDAEAELEQRLEIEKVQIAIRELKPIYQDILIMRFVEELSVKEVAEILERSEGAVKLLQHRALGQLKNRFK